MKGFTLQLYDSRRADRFEGVGAFVGEDASGSFGLLPGHARMMSVLRFGLARFRLGSETPWRYLALPGALLYFADNILTLASRHYLLDDDFERISARLTEELLGEEEALHEIKESLRRVEEAMLRRIWELGRGALHE
jgi:F-type H+-transporting ATPase subunit epsilon